MDSDRGTQDGSMPDAMIGYFRHAHESCSFAIVSHFFADLSELLQAETLSRG